MKKLVFAILMCLQSVVFAATASSGSPLGTWKTIDDVTGKPRAIVELYQDKHKQVYGKILKVFATQEERLHKTCVKCKGEKHDKPILGLVFLESLKNSKKNKTIWGGGKILDPKTGREYKCKMQLVDNGKQLNVRGYVGLPLFGRSQKWIRM